MSNFTHGELKTMNFQNNGPGDVVPWLSQKLLLFFKIQIHQNENDGVPLRLEPDPLDLSLPT